MENEIGSLISSLKSSSPLERRAAVEKLGQKAAPEAVPSLIPMLDDHSKMVRVAAVVALGKIGDDRAVSPLISLWRREIDNMLKSRDSDSAEIETVHPNLIALTLTNQFGSKAVGALIDNIDLFGVIYVLGQIGEPLAVDALLAVLDEPEITTQHSAAIMALGKIGDPRAIPTLQRFVTIQDRSIAHYARESIRRIAQRH